MELELNSTMKFYKYWFDQLTDQKNRNKTKFDVFNDVNNLYSYMYKTAKGKYNNYDSFMNELKIVRINPEQFN